MYKLANIIAKSVAATLVLAFVAAFFTASAGSQCNNMDELASVERPMVINGAIMKMSEMGAEQLAQLSPDLDPEVTPPFAQLLPDQH